MLLWGRYLTRSRRGARTVAQSVRHSAVRRQRPRAQPCRALQRASLDSRVIGRASPDATSTRPRSMNLRTGRRGCRFDRWRRRHARDVPRPTVFDRVEFAGSLQTIRSRQKPPAMTTSLVSLSSTSTLAAGERDTAAYQTIPRDNAVRRELLGRGQASTAPPLQRIDRNRTPQAIIRNAARILPPWTSSPDQIGGGMESTGERRQRPRTRATPLARGGLACGCVAGASPTICEDCTDSPAAVALTALMIDSVARCSRRRPR